MLAVEQGEEDLLKMIPSLSSVDGHLCKSQESPPHLSVIHTYICV